MSIAYSKLSLTGLRHKATSSVFHDPVHGAFKSLASWTLSQTPAQYRKLGAELERSRCLCTYVYMHSQFHYHFHFHFRFHFHRSWFYHCPGTRLHLVRNVHNLNCLSACIPSICGNAERQMSHSLSLWSWVIHLADIHAWQLNKT